VQVKKGKKLLVMLRVLSVSFLLTAAVRVASGYSYNLSDFATEVVNYVKGADIGSDWISGQSYDNAACALGRPTVDTTGDGWFISMDYPVPVVPVYSAYRAFELVTIGNGGSLTIKFDHPVQNNSANPYGLDFIIFGNAFQLWDGTNGWVNGDPTSVTLGATMLATPGIVSVSQDNLTWYTFASGPFASGFAPTLGRVYDPEHPDDSIGNWNLWWDGPTDPTKPLDLSLSPGSLAGLTVAQVATLYGDSAGGTGFDIGVFGLDWIRYVRVDDNPNNTGTTEIDAFADVAPLPEPVSALLLFTGFLAVAGYQTRRRMK